MSSRLLSVDELWKKDLSGFDRSLDWLGSMYILPASDTAKINLVILT